MRAFIAIKIPDPIKEEISKFQKGLRDIQDIKWVAPENIHLTLKFLGEIKEEQIENIGKVIKTSIQDTKPFNISFGALGGFPNLSRPRVLWIGIKEGKEKLARFMDKLDKEISKLGFEQEARESIPHLTIGRVKKNWHSRPVLLNQQQSFDYPPFTVDKVYLIKSELTPGGPIYTNIKEFKL